MNQTSFLSTISSAFLSVLPLNSEAGLCYNGIYPGWLDGRASALVGVRKVRAPQGTVLANCQAGQPDGKVQQRDKVPRFGGVRVKRCGKSAPAWVVIPTARQTPPGAKPSRDLGATRPVKVSGRLLEVFEQSASQIDDRRPFLGTERGL
jgi:hypothetical protein